ATVSARNKHSQALGLHFAGGSTPPGRPRPAVRRGRVGRNGGVGRQRLSAPASGAVATELIPLAWLSAPGITSPAARHRADSYTAENSPKPRRSGSAPRG